MHSAVVIRGLSTHIFIHGVYMINKIIHGCYRVKRSKRNSIFTHAHVIFSMYFPSIFE